MSQLNETCVICGFCHRCDFSGHRAQKAHYHWTPAKGEQTLDGPSFGRFSGMVLHATVCAEHFQDAAHTGVDWAAFAANVMHTPVQYRPSTGAAPLNAPLPTIYRTQWLDNRYAAFCYFRSTTIRDFVSR